MPQLTKGARKALDQIADRAQHMRDVLSLARDRTKFNPEYSRDKIEEALQDLTALLRVINEDIGPMLERQAPEYERRLTELEQRLTALEAQGSQGTIIPLHRKAQA